MELRKHIIYIFIVLSILFVLSCSSSTDTNTSVSNTASSQEKAVLDEMNYVRTKPKEYIKNRLEPLKSSYTGTKLSALNELISEMNSMSALPAYSWGDGLAKAAKDWVNEQGQTGATGHGDPWSRIKKYCTYSTAAENISYGYSDAKDIVIQLLVDDGVDGRGHRKNILSSSCTHAGAAIGTHKTYRNMCVIDFAGGYKEK